MRVNYNIQAIITGNVLKKNEDGLSSSTERLSSGFKINAAKDNPSGLAIAKRMNLQLRGISVASQNATDGISVVQTAEGTLSEMQDMVKRINELAIKACNETLQDSDREIIQEEVGQLKDELQRLCKETDFNGQKLLDGTFDNKGYCDNKNIRVNTFTSEVNPGNYNISIEKSGDTITASLLSSDAPGGTSFAEGAQVEVRDNTVIFKDKTGKQISLDVNIDNLPEGTTNAALQLTDIGPMRFQIGANEGQVIGIRIPAISLKNLGLENVDVSKEGGAEEAVEMAAYADSFISSVRSSLGAYQNRLENVSASLDTTNENLTGAYSRIMDVDMATEMTDYTTEQVLTQAATSMLAQANERPQQILQLLQ
ncbi:MAG: flagellin FliC3 [Lachnospiraceae bacterium]|nr:flagellin FliC3 [Lachnospiraceae bacterium]